MCPIKEIEEDLAIVQRKFDALYAERKKCINDCNWVNIATATLFRSNETSVKVERARSIGAAAARVFYSLAETMSLTMAVVTDHRDKLKRNETQMVQQILDFNTATNWLLKACVSVTKHSRIGELQVQYVVSSTY